MSLSLRCPQCTELLPHSHFKNVHITERLCWSCREEEETGDEEDLRDEEELRDDDLEEETVMHTELVLFESDLESEDEVHN